MALTRKRKAFVNYYIQCWNGAEAARKAGYSERSARFTANKLLRNPQIKAEIEKRIKELQMTADECLMLLAEQARSGNVRALELIGKVHGLFTDRVEHVGNQERTIRIVYDDRYAADAAHIATGGYRQLRKQERAGLRPAVGEDAPVN